VPRGKLILYALLAVVVTLGGGWLWGASGRFSIAEEARFAELRADLADARAKVLAARVALFQSNFGEATRTLEMAKRPLERARDRFRLRGEEQKTAAVDKTIERIEAARRLAAAVDASANTRAAEAVTLLDGITLP
jgi:hypothetical protein